MKQEAGNMRHEEFHTPVMIKEVLEYLDVQPGKKYIDATLGGGGHSAAILKRGGCVLGIDQDPEAVKFALNRLAAFKAQDLRFRVVRGNFKDLDKIAKTNALGEVAGILFDLGMSSWQIEKSGRGFSFQKDEVLDMRMDPSLLVTAADLVNGLTKKELYELFQKLGEEKLSKPLADAIVCARRVRPITKAKQLADLVKEVSVAKLGQGRLRARGFAPKKIHPATRVFQALRIAVNNELPNLQLALTKAVDLLSCGGRLAVISFHSLEDRLVKHEFLRMERESLQLGSGSQIKVLTKKPVRASVFEVEANPRARSAKLRVMQKLF